jgi:molybdenum cofactor biosynthesis enzyme MoaA
VGIIGSVTRPFCGTCGRVRLTAGGQAGNGLFAATGTGLHAAAWSQRRPARRALAHRRRRQRSAKTLCTWAHPRVVLAIEGETGQAHVPLI